MVYVEGNPFIKKKKEEEDDEQEESMLVRDVVIHDGKPTTIVKKILSKAQIKDMAVEILSEEDETGRTNIESIWRTLVEHAKQGAPQAVEQVLNRVLGRPVQSNVNLNGELSHADVIRMLTGDEGDAQDVPNE